MKHRFGFWLYGIALMNAEGGSGSGGSGDPNRGTGEPAGDGSSAEGNGNPAEEAGNSGDPLEGLPPNLRGESDQDTIKNLAKAVQGYRQRDSDNQVPDDLSAYSQFGDDVPEAIQSNLAELAEDKVFQRAAEKAKSLGIGVTAMQSLTTELFTAAADAGLLEPPIDVEAERQALVPDSATHLPQAEQQQAIELRMNENFAFLDQMVAREAGSLDKDAAEYAKTMLGDSANGHKFFEFMRSLTGGGSGPSHNPGKENAGLSKEELQRRNALPENTPGHAKFDKASYAQLTADFQKVYGDK